MKQIYWEHFAHEADIGVRGIGLTMEEAFEQAALATMAVITEPAGISPTESVDIFCQAPDAELLLVDWLNALIYEMATRKLLFGRFEVRIRDHELSARAWGEAVNMAKHQPAVEIKVPAAYAACTPA